MIAILLIVLAYVCGSVPTGYWLVKVLKGIDIRTVGSGSTGATNVLRAAGKGAGAFVFFFDIGKGWLPVWLSVWAAGQGMLSPLPGTLADWLPFVTAFAALIGHARSIFLGFQGGKSAATALGCVIAMNGWGALCSFALWVAMLLVFRFVSLASITAVSASGAFMYLFHAHPSAVAFCTIGGAYVVWRHKANIGRLLAGTEPRLGRKAASGSPASPAASSRLPGEQAPPAETGAPASGDSRD